MQASTSSVISQTCFTAGKGASWKSTAVGFCHWEASTRSIWMNMVACISLSLNACEVPPFDFSVTILLAGHQGGGPTPGAGRHGCEGPTHRPHTPAPQLPAAAHFFSVTTVHPQDRAESFPRLKNRDRVCVSLPVGLSNELTVSLHKYLLDDWVYKLINNWIKSENTSSVEIRAKAPSIQNEAKLLLVFEELKEKTFWKLKKKKYWPYHSIKYLPYPGISFFHLGHLGH